MNKILYIGLNNGEFVASPYFSDNCIVVDIETLNEPKRFLFKRKISIEQSYIDLHGWKFKDILLDDNQSGFRNYREEFTIECENPAGEIIKKRFFFVFPPRRIQKTSDDAVVSVILAVYLIVLTNNADVADEILNNICIPFYIPYTDFDHISYNLDCLTKLTSAVQNLKRIKVENDNERSFLNHLVSLYNISFNDYINSLKEYSNKKLKEIIEPK